MNKHQGFKAIRSLDYVILLCEDLEKVKNFYERLLEFQIEEDFPERMTFFRVGTLFLGLRKRGRAYDGPSVPSPSASRRLLVTGMTARLNQMKVNPDRVDPWATPLRERKPPSVATVAMANKTARIIWAVLPLNERYRPHTA